MTERQFFTESMNELGYSDGIFPISVEFMQTNFRLTYELFIFDFDDKNWIFNHIEQQRNQYKTLQTMHKFHPTLFKATKVNGNEKLTWITERPYTNTIKWYYDENKRTYFEMEIALLNILDLYKDFCNFEGHLHLNINNISFALVQSKTTPYPRIVISPYAAMKGMLESYHQNHPDELDEESLEELFLNSKIYSYHQQMAEVLDYLDRRASECGKTERMFVEEVEMLRRNENILKHLENNPNVTKLKKDTELQTISLDEYEKIESEEEKPKSKENEGTFGFVYPVRHKQTGIIYAMKQSKNAKGYTDIIREGYTLQQMKHKYIVKFKGVAFSEKEIISKDDEKEIISENDKKEIVSKNDKIQIIKESYLCEEFCQFGNLSKFIVKNYKEKDIPTEIINMMFGQLAMAVLYVHLNNFCHRDLKPDNIIISQIDRNEETNEIVGVWIKLCDFGFARSVDDYMNTVAGSPYTVHPSVLSGSVYGDTVDIFSVGAILYLMLFKKYPFSDLMEELLEKKELDVKSRKDWMRAAKKMMKQEIQFPSKDDKDWNMWKKYEDIIDFLKEILVVDVNDDTEEDDIVEEKGINWRTFATHSYVKKCINFVNELESKKK